MSWSSRYEFLALYPRLLAVLCGLFLFIVLAMSEACTNCALAVAGYCGLFEYV